MTVIMLMGLCGSGKSTKAKQLAKKFEANDAYLRKLHIINQDERGSRQACLEIYKTYLQNCCHVIIDRCNINRKQRAYWIQLALERSYKVELIWLDVDPIVCYNRILARKNHPTIKEDCSPEKIKSIINKFQGELEYPRLSEGFHSISIVKE